MTVPTLYNIFPNSLDKICKQNIFSYFISLYYFELKQKLTSVLKLNWSSL